MVEFISNVKIEFIAFDITIMLPQLLAESVGPFWQPAELENVANPVFENLKHLQNPGHLSLTSPSNTGKLCFLIHSSLRISHLKY